MNIRSYFHGFLCKVQGHGFGDENEVDFILSTIVKMRKSRKQSEGVSEIAIQCLFCNQWIDIRQALDEKKDTSPID
jgi:hypothetical protein